MSVAAERTMAELEAIAKSISEQMPPEVLRMEAAVMVMAENGFKAACDKYLEGYSSVDQSKAALITMSRPMFASEMAFGSGVMAGVVALKHMEKEAAKEAEASEEYRIIEDEVPCSCGCGKSIRAFACGDGDIQLELRVGRTVHGLMGLSPDGAKELAEQLLDARGC